MSDHEFENYLTLIGRLLRLSSSQREAIGQELRDHFESRLAELTSDGLSHNEAVRLALEEFGDAAGLAAQLSKVSQTRKRRLIMRCTVGSVATLAAAIVIAMASWPDQQAGLMVERAGAQTAEKQQEDKAAIPTRDQATAETEKRLNEYFQADFTQTPLQDVLAFVSDHFKVQIILDSKVLADAGIDPTALPITTSLSRVRGARLLDLVLNAQGLGYMIDSDGLVVVSTKEDLDSRLILRIYDCRKILAGELKVESSLPIPESERQQSKPTSPFDKLIDVIRTTIAFNTWIEKGGPGTISEYGGLLVVSQTQEVHEQVADLLEQLSEKLAAPAAN